MDGRRRRRAARSRNEHVLIAMKLLIPSFSHWRKDDGWLKTPNKVMTNLGPTTELPTGIDVWKCSFPGWLRDFAASIACWTHRSPVQTYSYRLFKKRPDNFLLFGIFDAAFHTQSRSNVSTKMIDRVMPQTRCSLQKSEVVGLRNSGTSPTRINYTRLTYEYGA